MNQDKPCEVEGCEGTYTETLIGYCNLLKVNTPEYMISVNDYHKLETKRNYHAVISTECSLCKDDLDERLREFCQNLFTPSPCNSAG